MNDEYWEGKLHKYSVISHVFLWNLMLSFFSYLFIGTKIFKTPQNVIDTGKIVLKLLTVEETVVKSQFCTLFF